MQYTIIELSLGFGNQMSETPQVVPRVVDCFIFYNELDMLEYRFSVMYPHVDAFVLVESTRTFIGNLKPLYYQENLSRFAKYADKIVHVVVDDLYANPKIICDIKKGEQWINEKHQRDGISLGIELLASEREMGKRGWKLKMEDILLISDVDEIIDISRLEIIQIALKLNDLIIVPMDMYYYNLKNKLKESWKHVKAITYSYCLNLPMTTYSGMKGFRNISEKIRCYVGIIFCLYGVFGWHLSCFGDEYMISNKLKEFSHQEHNSSKFTTPEFIKERMEKGVDILERSEDIVSFQRIEFSENPYLPPFPEDDVEKGWNRFPFCIKPSSGGSNGV